MVRKGPIGPSSQPFTFGSDSLNIHSELKQTFDAQSNVVDLFEEGKGRENAISGILERYGTRGERAELMVYMTIQYPLHTVCPLWCPQSE